LPAEKCEKTSRPETAEEKSTAVATVPVSLMLLVLDSFLTWSILA